jgi:hypothetical protein
MDDVFETMTPIFRTSLILQQCLHDKLIARWRERVGHPVLFLNTMITVYDIYVDTIADPSQTGLPDFSLTQNTKTGENIPYGY